MDLTKKLLNNLPKKHWDKVASLQSDSDLIDDCKYMLYWTDKYTDGDEYGGCYPVKSISEAAKFVKESLYE